MSRRIAPLASFLLLLSAGQAGARADTLLTIRSHTDSFQLMGKAQPAKDTEAKVWIAGEKVRHDEGESSEIFRFDLGKLYLVDHAGRTWSELDLPIDWKKLVPKGNEQMLEELAKAKRAEVSVQPSTEAKKIRDWRAQKVQVELRSPEGMRLSTAMWISRDLAFYSVYNRMAASQAALQGNLEWSRKLAAIDGFPVLQETTVYLLGTQFKTREELVAVEPVTSPANLFEVPGGYTAKPYDVTATPP